MLIPEALGQSRASRLGHQVLLGAIFEGEWRERGAQEGRAYS